MINKTAIGHVTLRLALAAVWLLASQVSVSYSDEQTREQFFRNAPREWDSLDQLYDNTGFESTFSELIQAPGHTGNFELRFGVCQQSGMVRMDGEQIDRGKVHFISNESYQATVSDRKGGFSLDSVDRIPGESLDTPLYSAFRHARPGLCFGGSCIVDSIVGTPRFHDRETSLSYILKDASKIVRSGREIVQLDLVFAKKKDGEFSVFECPDSQPLRFTVFVDPSRKWSIVAFESIGKGLLGDVEVDTKESGELEYAPDSFHPSRKLETTVVGAQSRNSTRIISRLQKKVVSKKQFYLSSFDLPEPPFAKSKSVRKVVSLGIFTILTLSTIVFIWFKLKSRTVYPKVNRDVI